MKRIIGLTGGLAALAALGLIGGISSGASLLLMIPAVILQGIAALCLTAYGRG